jgi:regulator of PEP synthase PpsR (kinase-PPPase family)
MVLFTLVDLGLAQILEDACRTIGAPCLSVLQPILNLFQSYIGTTTTPRPGAQHMLNAEYFKRIDALNFTLLHDDGQQLENYEEADILLIGVSRTSKTPTSIYLANRGIKAANIPLIPNVPLPQSVRNLKNPLIVGLLASPERIVQIRQNRLQALNATEESPYVDRLSVAEEVAQSRKLFAQHGWPALDVTRRSIEETAAAILDLYRVHRMKFIAQA